MEEYFALERDERVLETRHGWMRTIWTTGVRQGTALASLFLIVATIIIAGLLILWTVVVGSPVRPLETVAMLKKSRGIGWAPPSVRPVHAIWVRPVQDAPARIVS